eukprot:CAMPEP_0177755180 /NCGR_PEP_ID=MMETSP0491_2-20121128/2425_1 /TAXON_ID=63592 /ORGANISM="Tetraselmis chuii, Strain PLY429" /LENGTH=1350 /DNA_ID=CAMNT_0019270653 /DNA_START=165 /DNA_END=4213 /DNA_ORIENTATION=-
MARNACIAMRRGGALELSVVMAVLFFVWVPAVAAAGAPSRRVLAEIFPPVVNSVSTDVDRDSANILYGSFAGGTKIYIKGTGFSEETSGIGEVMNRVFVGGREATYIGFESSATMIVALTPAWDCGSGDEPEQCSESESEPQKITVLVDNARSANAPRDFVYKDSHTPYLYYMRPRGGSPGEIVNYIGNLKYWDLRSSSDALDRSRTLIGNQRCMLPEADLYGFDEDDYRYSVPCTAGDEITEPGFYNASIAVGFYYGQALIEASDIGGEKYFYEPYTTYAENGHFLPYQESPEKELYMYEFFPTITAISQSGGSVEGGQLITISGKGFSSTLASNEVDIDGTPCTVRTATSTKLTCVTTPWTRGALPQMFTGNRGVHREVFEGSSLDYQTLEFEEVLDSFDTWQRDGRYHQRLTSVFTAPTTGNYTFLVSSDDYSNMYISELQDSVNGLTQVLDLNSHCAQLFCSASQQSDKILLTAGVDYLIQVTHQEFGGQNYLHLGMVVPSDAPAYNSLREIQDVTISLSYTYEKQRFDIPITEPVTDGFYQIFQRYTTTGGSSFGQVSVPALSNASVVQEAMFWLGDKEVTSCTSSTAEGICFEVEYQTLVSSPRELIEIRFAQEAIVCGSLSCGLTPATTYVANRTADGSPPVSGTWAITYGDLSTGPIGWGASADTVRTNLAANPLFPPGPYHVERIANDFDTQTYRIEFVGVAGPIFSTLNVNTTELDGGDTITATTSVVIEGSFDRLLMPIPGYMLRTMATSPQLRVTSAGHPARCALNTTCDFMPSEADTPVVTSVEEFLGPDTIAEPEAARVLVIHGSGFSSAINGNNVTVANELCRIMDVQEDRITCALTQVVTGVNKVVVNVLAKGLARHEGSNAPFIVSGPLTIDSVSPTSGSVGGGAYITITGGVFPTHAPELVTVTFEEAAGSSDAALADPIPAAIVSVTSDTVVVKAPPNSELKAEFDNVVLGVAGQVYEFAFGYDESLTPLVTSVYPNLVSAVEPTLITIEGQGLGSSAADVEISLAGDVCIVRSIEADGSKTTCMWYPMDNTQLINCDVECERLIDGVPRTTHDLQYNVLDKGLTVGIPGALEIRVALEINSVVPEHGSLFGGTSVTIRGAGFGTGAFFPNTVSVGTDYPASVCDITFANLTYVECVTRPVAMNDEEEFQDVELTIRNVPTECKFIPYDDGIFYGMEVEAPVPGPAPGVLPDLGTLGTAQPPPPYPPAPPLYPPVYDTLFFYGVGEVQVAFARQAPTENWDGLADDAGQQDDVEHAFPGVDPFETRRRRGLLSMAPDAAHWSVMYGLDVEFYGLGEESIEVAEHEVEHDDETAVGFPPSPPPSPPPDQPPP